MLRPAPVSRARCFGLRQCGLTPYAACLVGSSLGVLKKDCWCWRNGFIWSLFSSKHVQSCVINACSWAGAVIHGDNTFFQDLHVTVFNGWWILTEFGEYIRCFKAHPQVCHADFFAFPRKADTTSHPVKAWNKSIPSIFVWSIAEFRACIGSLLRLCPWPKTRHSCCRPRFCRVGRVLTAIAKTHPCHWQRS
jgi:hypothetical protein